MKLGAKIFGGLAGVLILYLLLGIFLPGRWVAEVQRELPAPPGEVFPFLDSPEAWAGWNPTPESGVEMVGPPRGVGAGLEWDDPQYGSGRFRILVSETPHRVDYQVEIEGGSLTIVGSLELSLLGEGSLLRWTERGDFGWNPLMGYAARGMGASQGEAMRASLDTLIRLLEG